ncbi:SAM-dependent methyltransferase [Corynebacterium falsenii]|uniref:THUMP-like domain-containing protein n=1 Tax=Corynebacterium falsenii TaxID=108486 RepID=UPI00234DE96B|nr:SAM-dependent methyltransferase [Corynebacterium falsenii]MDC7104687.1 SAM-dependent methyltransferase [Corynebacterium falsenii]
MSLTASELSFVLAHPSSLSDAASLPLTKKSMVADVAHLKETYGDNARALVEVALARRSAAAKFSAARAEQWIMDSDSVQQATPQVVAEFRAAHLLSLGVRDVVDVTCSVGTELAALAAPAAGALSAGAGAAPAAQAAPADPAARVSVGAGFQRIIGGDLDPQRVRMARHNVPDVPAIVMDALRPALSASVLAPGTVVLADPARRTSSGRVTKLSDLRPRLEDLAAVYSEQGIDTAIKCAPGIDYTEFDGQVDVVSVEGNVKEACLYTPGLSQCGRRAVMLGVASGQQEIIDDHMPEQDKVAEVGKYIVDPDGAVVRAGLVRHYAAKHGLWQLDERIAYLTGPAVPPGRRGFEVLEQVPFKHVRKALVARGIGAVEILVRGVDINPDEVRKKWKLKGSEEASVVVTRIGDKAWAFICRAVRG